MRPKIMHRNGKVPRLSILWGLLMVEVKNDLRLRLRRSGLSIEGT